MCNRAQSCRHEHDPKTKFIGVITETDKQDKRYFSPHVWRLTFLKRQSDKAQRVPSQTLLSDQPKAGSPHARDDTRTAGQQEHGSTAAVVLAFVSALENLGVSTTKYVRSRDGDKGCMSVKQWTMQN